MHPIVLQFGDEARRGGRNGGGVEMVLKNGVKLAWFLVVQHVPGVVDLFVRACERFLKRVGVGEPNEEIFGTRDKQQRRALSSEFLSQPAQFVSSHVVARNGAQLARDADHHGTVARIRPFQVFHQNSHHVVQVRLVAARAHAVEPHLRVLDAQNRRCVRCWAR